MMREREIRNRMYKFQESCKNSYQAEQHDERAELERIQANSPLTELERNLVQDQVKPAESLWHRLWHRGEVACLFGDTNVGKSLFANQIANDIASAGNQVLYVDFENPDFHFDNHYKDAKKEFYNHPNITYVGLNYYSDLSAGATIEQKFEGIIDQMILNRTPIIIIDDISHILPAKFSEKSVQVLHRLRHLAMAWHVSILVLAHTRYHNPHKPLSITNLAGSREFAFSFDTVFALNRITNPEVLNDSDAPMQPTHYIRQFKTRATPIIFDEDNAMRLSMAKRDGILGFKIVDSFGIEAQLVAPLSESTQSQLAQDILTLHTQGASIRTIAHTLHTTPTIVYRTLQKSQKSKAVPSVPSIPAEESERQRALPSAPSAPNQPGVSGVSSVSSVSSASEDAETSLPSLQGGAGGRLPAELEPILNSIDPSLSTEIIKIIQDSGLFTLAYPYFQRDTPFRELWREPELLTKNRFTFSDPNYYANLIKERPTTHQLSFRPSASLKVWDVNDESPLMRCGSLVYNPNWNQLCTLSYTRGRFIPFPHTFPADTTTPQIHEAVQNLFTLTQLKSQLATLNESAESGETESLKAKIATLEAEVTAILPTTLHPLILPQKEAKSEQ